MGREMPTDLMLLIEALYRTHLINQFPSRDALAH